MKFVPDYGEFHHGIGTEDGTAEGEPRVVGASSIPPSRLSFGDDFRPLGGAPQPRQLLDLWILGLCIRLAGTLGRWPWDVLVAVAIIVVVDVVIIIIVS